jgi:hypothetical protein
MDPHVSAISAMDMATTALDCLYVLRRDECGLGGGDWELELAPV